MLARGGGPVARRAGAVQASLRDPSVELGEALARQEGDPVLGPARATLLRNAWTAGRLPEALRLLVAEDEERLARARKLRSALWRPMLLAVLTPIIIGVPTLVGGGLLAYLSAVGPPLFVIAALIACGIALLQRSGTLPRGLPLVGPLSREIAMSRAAHTLHHLFESGFPPAASLRDAARAAGGGPEARALREAAAIVERGGTLEEGLRNPRLPSIFRDYLRTGEVSGSLAKMARAAAAHHDEEILRRFRRLAGTVTAVVMAAAFLWAGWHVVQGWTGYFDALEDLP